MDREFLINLTKELYRLTLLFPKKEPLRYKARELADDILSKACRDRVSASLTETGSLSLLEELEVLDSFFEVTKSQNWVPLIDISKVQEGYNRIREEIGKISQKPREIETEKTAEAAEVRPWQRIVNIKTQQEQPTQEQPVPGAGINERQEKILEFLKENGRAQVWQVKEIFPEITKRTLRRDFNDLLKNGLIERIGERNNTFYQFNRTEQA